MVFQYFFGDHFHQTPLPDGCPNNWFCGLAVKNLGANSAGIKQNSNLLAKQKLEIDLI